jgi:hypothetical protein
MDSSIFGIEKELYTTREELQEWERTHWKCINWDVFDRLIAKNREFMESAETIKRYGFKVYAYNLEGQLLQVYENSKAAAEATGVELTIVNNYSKREVPYFNKSILYLRRPLEEVLKDKPNILLPKKDILPKTVYVYRNSTKEFLGQFQKVAEAEKALKLPDNTISNYVRKEIPMYKRDLLFLYHRLENEKII